MGDGPPSTSSSFLTAKLYVFFSGQSLFLPVFVLVLSLCLEHPRAARRVCFKPSPPDPSPVIPQWIAYRRYGPVSCPPSRTHQNEWSVHASRPAAHALQQGSPSGDMPLLPLRLLLRNRQGPVWPLSEFAPDFLSWIDDPTFFSFYASFLFTPLLFFLAT